MSPILRLRFCYATILPVRVLVISEKRGTLKEFKRGIIKGSTVSVVFIYGVYFSEPMANGDANAER